MWRECKALQPELVRLRRELHQIPEVGLQLPETAAYVTARLDEYGIPYETNAGDSGIVALIEGGKAGKTIALRADMDALLITEETGCSYVSRREGYMHACGHDCHTAMLLGAARVLKVHQNELPGNVMLLFQTAEEIFQGARQMLKNKALQKADAIFGIHIGCLIDKDIPSGHFLVAPGPVMAAVDRFVLRIRGVGCHGSTPEKGIDPVNIAAHIILSLQTINAREHNACVPVVLTIGKIQGGNQYNVLPDEVLLEGTVRTLDESARQRTLRRIREISEGTAAAFGGTVLLEIDHGAPSVVNDECMAALAEDALKDFMQSEELLVRMAQPNMGGEDFSLYLEHIPGAFLFLSSSDPALKTDIPHHNPRFNVDERVLWKGSAAFVSITQRFLNGSSE